MANYDDDEISEAGSVPSLDNLQYDEILDLDPEDIDRHPFEEKSEEAQFREQTWEQQWKEVVRSLVSGEARWDESEQGQGRLLEEYKKKALTSRDARERTTPTFLHILAKRRDTDDFGNLPSDTLSKIIKYLLEYQDSALVESGLSKPKDDPILRVAMEFNNTKFIESVTECSSEIPGKLDELLNATDHDGMNCLHYAFKEQLPKALGTHQGVKQSSAIAPERPNLRTTIKTIHGFVKEAKPETIAARDNYSNTPIHYAMDYNNCRLQVKQYNNIVQYLVLTGDKILKKNPDQQFNSNNESPYLYYLRTRERWLKQNKRVGVATGSATTSVERGGNRTGREAKPGIRTGALYESRKDTKDDYSAGEYQKKLLPPKPGTTEPSRTKMGPPPPLDKGRALYTTAQEAKDGTEASDYEPRQSRRPSVHTSENQLVHANPGTPTSLDNPLPKSLTRTKTQNYDQVSDSGQTKAPTNAKLDDDKSNPGKTSLDSDTAASKIGEFVKVHYIRTRTDMEAKELLYGKVASDKNLYFDASHLAGKTVDQVVDLIEKLSKAGGFEDTLSYVNLPILTTIHEKSSASKSDNRGYSSNEKRQRGGAHQENPKLGRSALISVFDKLVSVNIRHILRLQVDDREGLPHTDAAIERAIRGQDSFSLGNTRKEEIKIESWDWRKPDLSMDVISFAAPDATHINLYWSGNQTILKGWGYPEGIARDSASNGKLRRVTLHAFPGFESRDRMMKMIETFETEINDRTKGRVKIEKRIHSGTVTSSIKSDDDLDPSEIGTSDGPPQQIWVERMEDFRSSLISVHRLLGGKIKVPPVKVALIDDGVDLLNLDTYNIVQATGLSYCPPDGKTERPWHQSTNGHGTVMANMIVRINPWVSLDVMKIHESTSHSPGSKTRTIYAESAARAIEGAIIRKADIISMSWTIRKLAKKIGSVPNALDVGTDEEHKRSPEEVAMDALQKAIEKAKARNILMFCSAADDIQLLGRESLPFSAASDCILRIGAALPKGQRDPTSEDFNTISYFFPGNQVAEARNPRSSKPVEYHDGSSVSTALAAGLASLIIYCTNVVKTYYDDSRPFTDWALKLRNHKNMRTAFDNINSPDYDDKKFLPVWKTFGDATERINNAQGEKKKIVELENLVRILCHKLEAE
ncbi:hypothetical protein GGI42DRAFT_218651 [Trichoderma sp. SZMC 28013]